MKWRKIAFWGTVAGVSLLASFGAELAAQYAPTQGLRDFVSFIHKGPGGQSNGG